MGHERPRDRKQRLREEAEVRTEARAKRSDRKQLSLLEAKDCGGCQEAEKLRSRIAKEQSASV